MQSILRWVILLKTKHYKSIVHVELYILNVFTYGDNSKFKIQDSKLLVS